ncbi:alkaline phosphatase D family protein [Gillisia sp. Q332]|uniref:alkaline phosphatase D family protein n=1 Tax=Gillisia xinjiangensis TaxID=3384765 RepID=UPI003919BD37
MKQNLWVSLLLLLLNSCATGKNPEENQALEPDKPIELNSIESADFTIAFGSCNKQNLPQPLWDPIIANKPDVFIWGGDNIYADTRNMNKMEQDYTIQKANPGYQKLISSTPVLATWDDHDYGKNDAGTEWKYKKESQEKFLNFLEVPQNDERRRREGVYHSQLFKLENGSIKVILLDTRYFRSNLIKSEDPDKRYDPNMEGTVLGEEQWKWLERELKNSKADFNLIVSSIQLLSAEHGFETWGNFPKEMEKLKALISSSNAENIVLLSGDRHISEFSKVEIPSLKYPLIDFTSSGLTHTYTSFSGEPNQYRVGEVISDLSFGLLFFDFSKKKITMQMRGVGNTLQQELIQVYK